MRKGRGGHGPLFVKRVKGKNNGGNSSILRKGECEDPWGREKASVLRFFEGGGFASEPLLVSSKGRRPL